MEGYVDKNIVLEYSEILDKKTIVVNFYGCNFNCPFCFNGIFHEFKSDMITDLREIKQEINRIYFNAQTILFTGGEPTLQRIILNQLLRFSKGLELETAVYTNGSKPHVIEDMINQNLVDVIILDLKAPLEKNKFEQTAKASNFFITSEQIINNVKKSIDILRDNRTKVKVFVTTPVIPGLNFNDNDLNQIYEIIKYLRAPWVLIRFKKFSDYGSVRESWLLNKEIPEKKEIKEIILKINKANIPFKIV